MTETEGQVSLKMPSFRKSGCCPYTIKDATISPLDTEKDVFTWTNAAPSTGVAYILHQFKDPEGVNIVSSDSITFKKTKSLYIPFKAELAAIHWCLTKVDYDCHGARRIILKCDTKGHEIILEY